MTTASITCADPQFVWVEAFNHWSACSQCGRLAWEHEQADPVADIRNRLNGRWGSNSPPTMRQEGQQ